MPSPLTEAMLTRIPDPGEIFDARIAPLWAGLYILAPFTAGITIRGQFNPVASWPSLHVLTLAVVIFVLVWMLSTDKARSRIRTIALVARKGGSGKSTIATALAVAHELAGGRAVVVDLDPQGSATAWGALREADRPVMIAAQARRLQLVT